MKEEIQITDSRLAPGRDPGRERTGKTGSTGSTQGTRRTGKSGRSGRSGSTGSTQGTRRNGLLTLRPAFRGVPLRMVLMGIILMGLSCDRSYTPKPTGYMRIDYPEKSYRLYDDQEFFRFEIPTYAEVEIDRGRNSEAGWVNLQIPSLNGTIHLSYKPVEDNLVSYITDSRDLVYKHTVKAQGIEDTPFIHREENRFGMIYDLKGDVASAVQFFVTDSTTHFLRGSLYLNCRPNRDSLNPVIEFLREDIIHMIETTSWKY